MINTTIVKKADGRGVIALAQVTPMRGPRGYSIGAWAYYATSRDSKPTKIGQATAPVAGNVWAYTLNNVTRFRLVPVPYSEPQDVFYEAFADGVCSGKIIARNE